MRSGSSHGSKHKRLNMNNQDAHVSQTFSVPAWDKQFSVGLVADGSTGNPIFSRTEVGSNLSVLYSYRRIQELILSNVSVDHIPMVLYSSCTEFLWNLMNQIMPPGIVWDYPAKIKGRSNWTAQTRFKVDYLAATLLGFISDEEKIVTMTAGDGIVLVNGSINVIDQDDKPEYPVISINSPAKGFETRIYRKQDVHRLAIMSDGLKEPIDKIDGFVDAMFGYQHGNPLGIQAFLNNMADQYPELFHDDATVITFERGK